MDNEGLKRYIEGLNYKWVINWPYIYLLVYNGLLIIGYSKTRHTFRRRNGNTFRVFINKLTLYYRVKQNEQEEIYSINSAKQIPPNIKINFKNF